MIAALTEACRPACERGARIETPRPAQSRRSPWVAPRANAGRGLKHSADGHCLPRGSVAPRANAGRGLTHLGLVSIVYSTRRPACERGARIETPIAAPLNKSWLRRPACERGARIETFSTRSHARLTSVAPRANAGRGLKHVH